jgi:hypothetical protein
MGGQATYQRSTLSINHGTYFLDTTVADKMQAEVEDFTTKKPCAPERPGPCEPRSVNVFQADQAYYMFFVFAKNETKQTYQIYVGKGFEIATVKAYRPNLMTFPIESMREEVDWPDGWKKSYDGAAILTVTVDFANQKDYRFKEPGGGAIIPAGLCQPKTFCDADPANKGVCACALKENDPLVRVNANIMKACKSVCNEWAVKDLDYPQQGPLGFSFSLPAGFSAANQGLQFRPDPQPYPSNAGAGDSKPNWATKFSRTDTAPDNKLQSGAPNCYYARLPLREDKNCSP